MSTRGGPAESVGALDTPSGSELIPVWLNGELLSLPAGSTIATVVADLRPTLTGVAVALNEEVVPRSRWATTVVTGDDRVEVLVPTQGG